MQRHKQSAFTLVELIVVITILAILGTIAFISLQGYSAVSRDSVRISDVGTMTTALEVFQINAGKYPLPDQNGIFTYNGETLWTQGLFAGTVINNLSREMAKAPVDPLTTKEYTYSISGNKNEFQILNLLEGELVLNGTTQTNAAESVRTPRVTGSYNGIFVKTKNYLLPIPSIITSLDFNVDDETIIVSGTGITSQVISGGTNIPKIGNIKSGTGGIEGLSFEPVSIANIVSDGQKATVINAIKSAYSSSSLKDNGIYEYVIGVSGEENLAGLFDTIVLENFEDIVVNTSISNCDSGTMTGTTYNVGYNYDNIINGETGTGSITVSGSNSSNDYSSIISCNNGTVSISNENEDISCGVNYYNSGGTCNSLESYCNNLNASSEHSYWNSSESNCSVAWYVGYTTTSSGGNWESKTLTLCPIGYNIKFEYLGNKGCADDGNEFKRLGINNTTNRLGYDGKSSTGWPTTYVNWRPGTNFAGGSGNYQNQYWVKIAYNFTLSSNQATFYGWKSYCNGNGMGTSPKGEGGFADDWNDTNERSSTANIYSAIYKCIK